MDISCAFPTTLESPQHIKIAEDLGYRRAWLYDTPQQSPDVWMTLALAAASTERIGLGPGVLIPTLRHPMVNAAATAGLAAIAPGRVAVGFGTGFTGRRAMGYGAITWDYMERYITAYLGLLRGETVEWEGASMRMLHPRSNAPARPIGVPIVIGALGPKGREIAHRLGHGIFSSLDVDPAVKEFGWVCHTIYGTVRDRDEIPGGENDKATVGPGWALNYHGAHEFGGADVVRTLPGGDAWLAVVNERPADERHFAIHTGHLIALNDADHAAWDAGGSALADQLTISGTAEEVRSKVEQLDDQGVTEAVYQPAGPDIRRELERFMAAVR